MTDMNKVTIKTIKLVQILQNMIEEKNESKFHFRVSKLFISKKNSVCDLLFERFIRYFCCTIINHLI